jgi:hypothetical protein
VKRSTLATTPDELVCHLREAGATSVYLSRTDAFRGGVLSILATYATTLDETVYGTEPETTREMLRSVFNAIGDRLWFHGREWNVEWDVKPAFDEPRTDLVPLYDRRIERKYGDGFNLWNLYFVYEERLVSNGSS